MKSSCAPSERHGALGRERRRGFAFYRGRAFIKRDPQFGTRALPKFALNAGDATNIRSELLDGEQTQPGPGRLGRVEQLERSTKRFARHAAAAVADRNRDVASGLHSHLVRLICANESVCDVQGDTTTFRHRVARIEREIDERGLELRGVDMSEEARFSLYLQADTVSKDACQKAAGGIGEF